MHRDGNDPPVSTPSAPRLRQAATDDGIVLRNDAMSLAELDGLLSAWRSDDVERPWLPEDVARYVCLVLAGEVQGATARQDGTVVLADGSVIDVPAVVRERLTRPNADLRGLVREVVARPARRRPWWRRRMLAR